MLNNVKMPTIVGILIFINMLNATFESLKDAMNILGDIFVFQHFISYEQLKFYAHLS